MRLTFLGTRGEIEEKSKLHQNHSAVLLETHGKKILLDFGTTWQGKFKLFKPDYIWISHAHPDHCFGLKNQRVEVPVFMSSETDKRLPKEKFPFLDRRVISKNFKFNSISALELAATHSTKAPMSGLIIQTDEGKIGYFPDVLSIPDYEKVLKGLTIYIGDGSSLTRDLVRRIKGKPVGHASVTRQMSWCQKAYPVEKMIFTHWGKEAVTMRPEKLAQKILELSQKHCPLIPVEIAIDNLKVGPPKKGEKPLKPGERVFVEEYALSNYLGSKRQYVNEIFKYIPENTKTLFDGMCGVSHVLIEAARRGIEVIGNDFSPLAYLYSAGVFQGEELNEKDIEKFKKFPPQNGWLAKSNLKRPEKRESKRIIDGLIVGAWKNFSARKRRAALAVLSNLIQHYFRGFQAFIAEEEPYSKEQILKDLDSSIKEINSLIKEVRGKGKIFSRDILKEKIPASDVIYFDPPFFPQGTDNIRYFKHYVIANSVLMQRRYEPKDPMPEEIIEFLPRLAAKTSLLIISSASPSKINWEKELSKLKKNVKKMQLKKISTGSQPQSYPGHIDKPLEFRENLFCAADAEIKVTRKSEVPLFRLEGYDPRGLSNKVLMDDLRLVSGKFSNILHGKKTEFKNKEECINFAERVMKEILKRGKITFHPEYRIEAGKAKIIEK